MNDIQQRTVALAGVLQACAQVQALARTGSVDEAAAQSSIKSILVLDAVNTPAVYGGIAGISAGLQLIRNGALSSASAENVELIRYVMSLLHLQNQLSRDRERYQSFSQQVEQLSRYSGDELVTACSEIYQEFLSGMRPQIIVQGEQGFLQRDDVPARVRSLLLAGIRSAVLWQQKGGGRFKLLLERGRMVKVATELLSDTVVH